MSGKTFTFQVNRTSSAPAGELFALVSDGSRWSEWAKPLVPNSTWAKHGDPAPAGVGAIRKLGVGKFGVKEETTAHEQDRLHAYRLITPGPVKDYHAEVRFTPRQDGGTDLVWTGTATERIPGTAKLAERTLHKLIDQLASKLVKAAERAG